MDTFLKLGFGSAPSALLETLGCSAIRVQFSYFSHFRSPCLITCGDNLRDNFSNAARVPRDCATEAGTGYACDWILCCHGITSDRPRRATAAARKATTAPSTTDTKRLMAGDVPIMHACDRLYTARVDWNSVSNPHEARPTVKSAPTQRRREETRTHYRPDDGRGLKELSVTACVRGGSHRDARHQNGTARAKNERAKDRTASLIYVQ
jgi:hypothetical protein